MLLLINPNDNDIYLNGNKELAIVSQVEKEHIFSLNNDLNETTNSDHPKPIPNFSFGLC